MIKKVFLRINKIFQGILKILIREEADIIDGEKTIKSTFRLVYLYSPFFV